jgi:ABC-type antimicrobial peptide transport system permease subunit
MALSVLSYRSAEPSSASVWLWAPRSTPFLKLVTRERGVVLVLAAGTALGVCLSYAVLSGLRKMLFNVSPHGTFTFIAAAGVLSAVAIVASWLPARRAMRVDPMVALR